MRTTSKQFLCASLALSACSAAIGDERNGPVDTIRSFYQRYLNSSDRQAADTPDLAYSKKFSAEIDESASVCAKYVDGPCGWGSDSDVYLDTQETDPLLRYDNSRFAIKQLDAGTVQVRFNVYPSEKDDKGFYDKLVTYRMIKEGGRWVVDDVSYRDGVSARAAGQRKGECQGPSRPAATARGGAVRRAIQEDRPALRGTLLSQFNGQRTRFRRQRQSTRPRKADRGGLEAAAHPRWPGLSQQAPCCGAG